VYGDDAILVQGPYTSVSGTTYYYDFHLLFIEEGEEDPYAVFLIDKCEGTGSGSMIVRTIGDKAVSSATSCWFRRQTKDYPAWWPLSDTSAGHVLPNEYKSFSCSDLEAISSPALMSRCSDCLDPALCSDPGPVMDENCVLTWRKKQLTTALPVSGITTSDLYYSSLLPQCCVDQIDRRKVIGGTTALYTSWCTDRYDKCGNNDWCQWYNPWFSKTWKVQPGDSNYFTIGVNMPGQSGGVSYTHELIVEGFGIHILNTYSDVFASKTYMIYYHGPPIGDLDFFAKDGFSFIGHGCLWISIVCNQMARVKPIVRECTISNAMGSTDISHSLSIYLESHFYVEYATIRVYKAIDPPAYINDWERDFYFSALTYEFYKESDIIPFTVEDNNGTQYDRQYPNKTTDYVIGEYGLFRLAVVFTNDAGDSEEKFFNKTWSSRTMEPVCIMDEVSLTPVITVVSVPSASEPILNHNFTVDSGIVYSCYWTWTLKTDPVFPGTVFSGGSYFKSDSSRKLKYAGTYGMVLDLNVERDGPEAAPVQRIVLDDLEIPVPDPWDSLSYTIGSVSAGKRTVTFSFRADWYRTGLTLVCHDDADTTVTRTQSSHTATLSGQSVTYTCSEEPYTIEYTVYSPVSTKTYFHELYIEE
jgi:hypothetical protein